MPDIAERIYQYIINYKRAHDGNSPTYREIRDACRISSTSIVSYWIDKLVASGRLRLSGDTGSRKIIVVGGQWSLAAEHILQKTP